MACRTDRGAGTRGSLSRGRDRPVDRVDAAVAAAGPEADPAGRRRPRRPVAGDGVARSRTRRRRPSLRTLAQLSQALSVPVPVFFRELSDQEDASFVGAGEGIELTRPGSRYGYRYELLAAQLGSRRVAQPYLVTIAPDAQPYPLFQHRARSSSTCSRERSCTATGPARTPSRRATRCCSTAPCSTARKSFMTLPIRLLSITLTRSDEAIEP